MKRENFRLAPGWAWQSWINARDYIQLRRPAWGIGRKYGLTRDQRLAVATLHSSEVNQRIVSGRPDLAARHADVWAPPHPALLYPLVNWMYNQRMWAMVLWYWLRYP